MIFAFTVLVLASYVLVALYVREALAVERARVNDLLTLLEAKAAPAEAAAYLRPVEDPEDVEWAVSEDGLVAVEVPLS